MEDALNRGISHIYRALLNNGYSNFSLTILEYCEVSDLLIREKHYWDILNHEYNIAKDPTAPMSGRKHSDKSKQIMSDTAKKNDHSGRFKPGENHPRFGQNHTDETKKQISDAMVGNTNGKNNPNSQVIEVTDIKNNTTISYDSMSEAARALNINMRRISAYFVRNQLKPYKGLYTFKKL
jgi:group I intron endonuclease